MQGKILILDNCRGSMAVLTEMLEDNYELETTEGLDSFIDKMLEFRPDIVIMDVLTTGSDVYEVCRKIKASPAGPFTQVILVSERSSSEQKLRGYEMGADDYLIKPFDQDDLLAKVNIHLRLHKSMAEIWTADSKIAEFNEELGHIVKERTTELPATRDIAVFSLAELAESHDPETCGHLKRVRGYCSILSEELCCDGPYCDQIDFQFVADIYHSSPLHDIGKIGIPDAILLKPGRLSTEEFKTMQRHSVIGADALQRTVMRGSCGRFFEMAIDIARSHHERFNGSGYPDGLCGSAIPLSARIVALADVFDALTSERVYKPAYSIDVAKRMIEDESAEHFDPVIVGAFERRLGEFVRICESKRHYELEMVPSFDCDDVRR